MLVFTPAAALDLPAGLDPSEIALAEAIVDAGMSQAASPALRSILEHRATKIVMAINDVKDITERGGEDLGSIEFPLDVRTPIETLVRSMPGTFDAFSLDYLRSISETYKTAYESVVVATQALVGERNSILDTLRDPDADHDGLADRLIVLEDDMSVGQAASRILEAQTRFLIQTKGRVEFIQSIDR